MRQEKCDIPFKKTKLILKSSKLFHWEKKFMHFVLILLKSYNFCI